MLDWNKALPDLILIFGIIIFLRLIIIFRKKLQSPYLKRIKEINQRIEDAHEILDEIWPNRPGIRRKQRKAKIQRRLNKYIR